MNTISLTIPEIHELARRCLLHNGCDAANAEAIATTVSTAERDGSYSHGLFRVPGYVASLRSGKVNGKANPQAKLITPAIVRMDGDNGYTPLAIQRGVPILADAAQQIGIAAMGITNTYHFAALWPETEALAERGLVGLACTAYKPTVAPHGAKKPLFGTNPLSFAWPRPGQTPLVFDMATSAKALGDVQIAARDGHQVPLGTGLDPDGNPTTDPAKIANGGVLLPFGGYKGSAIAMMVELLCAGMVGERFSFEAAKVDNNDGGPAGGGEFLLAMSPAIMAGPDWAAHAEGFFAELTGLEGVRLPGQRRHENRLSHAPRPINAELVEEIRSLCE
ncbi:MAG: Ldh family oxidoreductase [Caldilineaceae bacterium]|nr:Ldh family oxidoreductase [Caldilineaceae bacterium]